jgi:hypothetical protein
VVRDSAKRVVVIADNPKSWGRTYQSSPAQQAKNDEFQIEKLAIDLYVEAGGSVFNWTYDPTFHQHDLWRKLARKAKEVLCPQ